MRSHAERSFLPFTLRLLNTDLPLAVAILFLKPCSIFLCLTFGWYVLNICPPPILFLYINNKVFSFKNTKNYYILIHFNMSRSFKAILFIFIFNFYFKIRFKSRYSTLIYFFSIYSCYIYYLPLYLWIYLN